MSDNRLIYDMNNSDIQGARNCLTRDGLKQLNVNYKSRSHDDKCYVDIHTRQSVGPGNYQVTNLYDCECEMPQTVKTATNTPLLFFKNGYDVGSCVVDESTQLRVGLTKRFPRCPQQLFTRPYLTTPYAGRGGGDIKVETMLQPGEDTSSRRPCNVLSGVSIPNFFTPLVDHLEANVQNPVHIVEEVADPSWIRGGAPSRLVVRDVDYLERCGYSYMDKATNREFWVNKHAYL